MSKTDYQIMKVKEIHATHRAANNFVSIMKLKLYENLQKGKGTSWKDCSYDYLRKRIDEELKELDDKINEGDQLSLLEAREECADCANFLMFISDNISYGNFKRDKN